MKTEVEKLVKTYADITITVPIGVGVDCNCGRRSRGSVAFNFNADEVIINQGSLESVSCPSRYTAGEAIVFTASGADYGQYRTGSITFKKITF